MEEGKEKEGGREKEGERKSGGAGKELGREGKREGQASVWVVVVRKDFWAAPKFLAAFTEQRLAIDFMWSEAKRRWRYTGKPLDSYNYFDQSIRMTEVPLND